MEEKGEGRLVAALATALLSATARFWLARNVVVCTAVHYGAKCFHQSLRRLSLGYCVPPNGRRDAETHTFGSQNIFLMRSFLLYDFAIDLLNVAYHIVGYIPLRSIETKPQRTYWATVCVYNKINCTSTVLLLLYKHRCKLNATCKCIPLPLGYWIMIDCANNFFLYSSVLDIFHESQGNGMYVSSKLPLF